jgi:hypothetical protein
MSRRVILTPASMSDPKQTSERLQAIIAESKRAAREIQVLVNRTHEASKAYARLARALREVGADLNESAPRSEVPDHRRWFFREYRHRIQRPKAVTI